MELTIWNNGVNMIKIFDDLYDAILFLETEAEQAYRSNTYFKAEWLNLEDGRYRVGIFYEAQLEMKL